MTEWQPLDCGCVVRRADHSGAIAAIEIKRCPLHAAAELMYAELRISRNRFANLQQDTVAIDDTIRVAEGR